MTKSALIASLNNLPDEFTLEEIIERLIVIEKIEMGLAQIKNGQVLSTNDVKKRLDKWLK